MKRAVVFTTILVAGPLAAADVVDPQGRPTVAPESLRPTPGVIERRPIWDRPTGETMTLQQQTESALDRGNGRIEDPATFELRQVDRDRAIRATRIDDPATAQRLELERFQAERDRQLDLERQQRQRLEQHQPRRVVEYESDRLAAERERWLRSLAKPRHGEAAVVDRQIREQEAKPAAAAAPPPTAPATTQPAQK
jgi:hypothetical protein